MPKIPVENLQDFNDVDSDAVDENFCGSCGEELDPEDGRKSTFCAECREWTSDYEDDYDDVEFTDPPN